MFLPLYQVEMLSPPPSRLAEAVPSDAPAHAHQICDVLLWGQDSRMWSAARHLTRAPLARALVAAGGLTFLASPEPHERRAGPGVARCDGMLRTRSRAVWDDLSELAREHQTQDTWPW